MRRFFSVELLFGSLFFLIFFSFLYPEANPDVFWHLASARKAQELGRWYLDKELFSFTLQGASWVNYEWLFQWLAFKIWKLGGFALIAVARALLITGTLVLLDRYLVWRMGWKEEAGKVSVLVLRLAALFLVNRFMMSRGSFQPELFTLFFLVIFFFLRDGLMDMITDKEEDQPYRLGMHHSLNSIFPQFYFVLFALWANIHGGFVWALGLLGLEFLGTSLEALNAFYKLLVQKDWDPNQTDHFWSNYWPRLKGLAYLGITGLVATMLNPYGIQLHQFIFGLLGELSTISTLIQEWQPMEFYFGGSAHCYGLLAATLALLLFQWLMGKGFNFSGVLITLFFGYSMSNHVRHLSLFALMTMPIFIEMLWANRGVIPAHAGIQNISRFGNWVRDWIPACAGMTKASVFTYFIGFLFLVSSAQAAYHLALRDRLMAGNLWALKGLQRDHMAREIFPEGACQLLEKYSDLLKLNIWTEWGWGGYGIWRLHDKGARFYFDGRYLFHSFLERSSQIAKRAENWSSYLRGEGVELCVIAHPGFSNLAPFRTPKTGGKGFDASLRTWPAVAYPPSEWAMIWWDHLSVMFVRRDRWPKSLPAAAEYKTRFNIDPYWIEQQWQRGKVNKKELIRELNRNVKEAGPNFRNTGLLRLIQSW